jgi:hypothetical protein
VIRRSLSPSAPPPRESKPPPKESELVVSEADVERIDVLQSLLTTLNDPRASATALARDVERMPVLQARIEVRYRARSGGNYAPPRLSEQIGRLGNRELEGILLELLEDVVIVGSELAETRRSSQAPAAPLTLPPGSKEETPAG